MQIDSDPTPSPSPGEPPTPPGSKPKPEGWQVPPLDPPPGASKVLADYFVGARKVFQALAEILGTPEYAVPPPIPPPAAPPPSLPEGEAVGLTGFAATALSTSQNVLQGHSAGWQGTDGTNFTIAQRAATVGSAALKELQEIVYRLQDVLNAAVLVLPASYTERPSAGGNLTSFAELKLAGAVDQALRQAYDAVSRAKRELGLETALPRPPEFPKFSMELVPPRPAPMPQRQEYVQNPGILEV
ncbi:hypothetical protein OHA40_25780 [Nocardia sp. NBC_00508]|uniref:hypothetical protein n=1 Tax=Nocardia sp. NBC_00508 TaxID=2975992 RepID=UPI002E80E568|nr:hypothetical protein [Nocardia sp. NBC_00508]WUD65045.1 hypothetical protein OHA40_25780 [Nocardia sp. NBC_00508]